MKIHAYFATLCFLAATVCADAQSLSGPVTNAANSHLYYHLSGFVTWGAAEAAAVAMNGHLATIRSSAENQWIQDTFRTSVGSISPLWIGLNDLATEGTFEWSSGTPLTYANWEPGAPDDSFGLEDAVYLSGSGQWNDSVADFTGLVEGAIIEVVPLIARLQFATNASISWNSESNRQYQVQYSSLLTSNSWANLGSPVTATGTNSTLTDAGALQTRRFYRVVQIP
jgi:hypothetical protein